LRNNFVNFTVDSCELVTILSLLKGVHNFIHLSMISCTDWIENNQFELNYIVWSPEHKVQLMISVFIDREKAEFVTISNIWRQAQTFERDIHEMYGIDFKGNKRQTPFVHEDWEWMPPMRRDFDTVQFVEEHYFKQEYRDYSLYKPVREKFRRFDFADYSFENIDKSSEKGEK